jgi:hypothetical protein
MIFQYTWPQVTRRVISPTEVAIRTRYNRVSTVKQNGRTKWQVGATYAVQPGRGQSQIARIQLTRITRQRISRITNAQARAEGFADRQAFLKTWQTIHGSDSVDQAVWVIEFELVEVKAAVKKLTWPEPIPQSALALMTGTD